MSSGIPSKPRHAHGKARQTLLLKPEINSEEDHNTNSPQRAAPASFVVAAHALAQYVMPSYQLSPLQPIQPPHLSQPTLTVPQHGYYWAPQQSAPPMAPMGGQRAHYYREEDELPGLGNYSLRPITSRFYKKLSSGFSLLLGGKQPGLRENTVQPQPSYSQQAPQHIFVVSGQPARTRQRVTDCDPDDLLLKVACCCCWPIGLAAKIITAVFPRETDSCVGYLARQLSVCALLLGIAIYLVIMVVLISLVAALAVKSNH